MTEEQKAFERAYTEVCGRGAARIDLVKHDDRPDEYFTREARLKYESWRMTVEAVKFAIKDSNSCSEAAEEASKQ